LEEEPKYTDEWFTELEKISVLLVEDHACDNHIIYNIKHQVYVTMAFTLKRDLQYNTTTPLHLEIVKDEIRQIYGQFHKEKLQKQP
jgi:hypothetical protein